MSEIDFRIGRECSAILSYETNAGISLLTWFFMQKPLDNWKVLLDPPEDY